MEKVNFKEEYKGIKKWIEQKNIDLIMKRVSNLNGIEDILGKDREGYVPHGSFFFYVLPHLLGKYLDNDPDKTITQKAIEFRKKYLHNIIMKIAPNDLHGKELIKEKESPLPKNKPIIFTANHGFMEDATSTYIISGDHAYYCFGSIPQMFNTSYGLSLELIGCIAINRKNTESRRGLVDKASKVLELGGNIIMFPEATHNRTANKLVIDYWPGIFRIAKKTGAVVVPITHLLVDDKIYSSRLPYIDFSKYNLEEEKEALEELKTVICTELYSLMDKYAHTTREELMLDAIQKSKGIEEKEIIQLAEKEKLSKEQIINSLITSEEVYEKMIRDKEDYLGKYYDFETERLATYHPKEVADMYEVWEPIINACNVPKEENEILKMIPKNYQRRY